MEPGADNIEYLEFGRFDNVAPVLNTGLAGLMTADPHPFNYIRGLYCKSRPEFDLIVFRVVAAFYGNALDTLSNEPLWTMTMTRVEKEAFGLEKLVKTQLEKDSASHKALARNYAKSVELILDTSKTQEEVIEGLKILMTLTE